MPTPTESDRKSLERHLETRRGEIDGALDRWLPPEDGPAATIARAMRYAVFGGGKRLRPLLALVACEALGGERRDVIDPAAAVEMVHTYSLIHDDLPAMDDDDLRRGRPTVHRAFGVAEAILAGDGLLTLAFEVLGSAPDDPAAAARRAESVAVVARGAGVAGMVGGQVADLEAEGVPAEASRVEWIHRHKTGSLLSASAEIGAIHAGAGDEARAALRAYGAAIGLAFQITDDILDETSTAETLGKTPGKDHRSGKATYPALFGIERSRATAEQYVQAALDELGALGPVDPTLRRLARYVVSRVS